MKENELKTEAIGLAVTKPKTSEVYFKFNDSKPIKIGNLDEN